MIPQLLDAIVAPLQTLIGQYGILPVAIIVLIFGVGGLIKLFSLALK